MKHRVNPQHKIAVIKGDEEPQTFKNAISEESISDPFVVSHLASCFGSKTLAEPSSLSSQLTKQNNCEAPCQFPAQNLLMKWKHQSREHPDSSTNFQSVCPTVTKCFVHWMISCLTNEDLKTWEIPIPVPISNLFVLSQCEQTLWKQIDGQLIAQPFEQKTAMKQMVKALNDLMLCKRHFQNMRIQQKFLISLHHDNMSLNQNVGPSFL